MNTQECSVCKQLFPEDNLIPGHGINHEIEPLIKAECPSWEDSSHICRNDFERFRNDYIKHLITDEIGQIKTLESDVVSSIAASEFITSNINNTFVEKLKTGDKIADKVAKFGGSWAFIITFFAILTSWIIINSILLLGKPFDPYPFILLNLVLSCIAAIQAPVIMMSQNRQEAKDRIRSEGDYKVNLKAEIEIRTLHEKVDHLLLDQWSKMMNIQQMQIDILEEIRSSIKKHD